MEVTLLGMVMVAIFEHKAKVPSSIDAILFGMVMDVKPVQP